MDAPPTPINPGPAGTVLPNAEPLWTVRLLFPQLYPRLVEIVQMLGSSNLVMMPSLAEFAGARADDVELYCQGVGISAEQRVRLFRLAWDVSCSSFAGRQTLYERFSRATRGGSASRATRAIRKDSLRQRVWDFIARAGRLTAPCEERLRRRRKHDGFWAPDDARRGRRGSASAPRRDTRLHSLLARRFGADGRRPLRGAGVAALATKRIVLGTGVAIAGTRIAPVTACAIASVGALARGRVVLGLGTGNSARRAMGMPPYRVTQLRESVRVVRGLLGGGEVDYREGELNLDLFFPPATSARRHSRPDPDLRRGQRVQGDRACG